jgi:hypothetical protein
VAIVYPSHAEFAEQQKIPVYKQLYTDIENRYHLPAAGPRFGNLLLILNYVEVIFSYINHHLNPV